MAQDEMREQIHTSLPAQVAAYYPPTSTAPACADLEICVNRPIVDLVTGELSYETFPIVPQVPIALPRGGGFALAFPLNVGDEVLFVCTMYDFEAWRTTGQVSNPTDVTAHGLQGWAFPCVIQDGKPMVDYAAAAAGLVIGVDGQPGQIRIPTGGAVVDLGAGASNFVALANLVDSAVSTIVSAFNSHTHPVTALGSPTGPPAVPISPAPGTTAATVVKAQ